MPAKMVFSPSYDDFSMDSPLTECSILDKGELNNIIEDNRTRPSLLNRKKKEKIWSLKKAKFKI